MPRARCRPGHRGGLIVIGGRPINVHAKWVGAVPHQLLDLLPFLEHHPHPPAEVGPPPFP
jgi:hypothetical protein